MEPKLTKDEMREAISEGVERAIWRMITGITDMPSRDFWDTMEAAMGTAFLQVSREAIERIEDGE